ncbi:AFL129Wp [Eremothecium gossypii ATCC 10895]|uniref:Protein PBDC1 homolog n=1 Tax=Eremothecium gossypii (strain ATCC 10895 / CBS 109.51 / FGSC 9923 / NRRL Y-1056) TaxID=284811 RepID=Q755F2_EREGS|nr:AFL129Wp [Eremothecium gossypii ATCC 10895]AAS53245.1 AFL129Wp [Eremothecium gossypii ATCC 10895]AEY97555.1 FAFL129Wp [Eremothecium gossypii FDAG1]
MSTFNAETADNLEDIEKQFAVVAVEQAETYWGLISKVPGSKLRLTKYDDEIYETFMEHFPEYRDIERVARFQEEELKTKEAKERWRKFIGLFEKKIDDFNFGTLLRTDARQEYGQFTTCFVVRLQFYAFEIARNKHGLNDWAVGH